MNKYEKYLNYIINDILSETVVDMEGFFYRFPFMGTNTKWNMGAMDLTTPIDYSSTNKNLYSHFCNYVGLRYGTSDEETKYIWDRYVERIPK